MPYMPYAHINRADLNLLHTLFALLEERHVTRAARRCFLSQPAMSRALDRLGEMFGDELLIRVGREYERTPRGERLLRDLESLFPRLELLLKGEHFDPAQSEVALAIHGIVARCSSEQLRHRSCAGQQGQQHQEAQNPSTDRCRIGTFEISIAEPDSGGKRR
jgi:hypothetical protein